MKHFLDASFDDYLEGNILGLTPYQENTLLALVGKELYNLGIISRNKIQMSEHHMNEQDVVYHIWNQGIFYSEQLISEQYFNYKNYIQTQT